MKENKQIFNIITKVDGAYTINSSDFIMCVNAVSITTKEDGNLPLEFKSCGTYGYTLAGHRGEISEEVSEIGGITVTRQFFKESSGSVVAMRLSVKNNRDTKVRLDEIKPMIIDGADGISICGGLLDTWKVLRYPFHKSDIPSCYMPSVADKDFEDAAYSCINAIPGQGAVFNTMNRDTRTTTSGAITIFSNVKKPDKSSLMLSILGTYNHFFEVSMTTSEDRKALKNLTVACSFDGVVLKKGEETNTHWLLITADNYEGNLLKMYAETVAELYNVKKPEKPSFTVFCTWYFYTFLVREQHIEEEVQAIKEKRIPIDVFQIDDGWMDSYGSYEPNAEKFPKGMKYLADLMKDAGLIPGIWLAPFVVETNSPVVKKYPDIYQKDAAGNLLVYPCSDAGAYILDPTVPETLIYLEELFNKVKGWGYTYFKLDWLRAIYEFSEVEFRDKSVNRAKAYEIAFTHIKKILGNECYILGCGGLADPGNMNLANGNRTSKDVRGTWVGPADIPNSGAIIQIKQNLLRNYTNRFWDTDPDATQIRIRRTPFDKNERKCVGVYQSEGLYSDEEAFTICAHQYLSGGLITISERFPELQEERLALLRHITPACTEAAKILDFKAPVCPTLFLNTIAPKCGEIGNWWTLSVGNWEDKDIVRNIKIDEIFLMKSTAERFAVFEFKEQKFMGIYTKEDAIKLMVPKHGIRVLRIVEWNGLKPVILGTDLHITGGAYEITQCSIEDHVVRGRIESKWQQYPVVITAGFPDGNNITVKSCSVEAGCGEFEILN